MRKSQVDFSQAILYLNLPNDCDDARDRYALLVKIIS